MKKIIIEDDNSTVYLSQVNTRNPIFAKKNGKLAGMLVLEPKKGWILRIGGECGSTGHYSTAKECIESGIECEYEFFYEE